MFTLRCIASPVWYIREEGPGGRGIVELLSIFNRQYIDASAAGQLNMCTYAVRNGLDSV